jgi:3D (Asp-Asp-Asp) domain-containing protein
MLNDLIPNPTSSNVVRRGLVVIAAIAAIGIAAVGTARETTGSLPRANSVSQSALSDELMHDLTVETADEADARPSLVIPETITALRPTRTLLMEVTAYCACTKCCGPNAIGLTASGKHVSYNNGKFVAADTAVLPFGSKLMIPGYHDEAVEVVDRGGAIKGNKLDVFYASHDDALKWGRQKVLVTVVD